MTQQIESGALTLMNEILQLGAGGQQTTVLDDGNVSQVLDVRPVIRRSLTFANTGGLFYFGLQTVHAGAGVLLSVIIPYDGTVGANSFPTIIPRGFDIWLLYAVMRRVSGAGALTGGSLEVTMTSDMRGKGTSGFLAPAIPVGLWDSLEADTLEDYAITAAGETMLRPNLRMRRGTRLQLRTNSAGIATFEAACIMGAFPAGLEQDGAT